MIKKKSVLLLGALACLFTSVTASAGGDYARCEEGRCFSWQSDDVRTRVLNGETIVQSVADPASSFELVYVLRRVRGADPELIAGLFATTEDFPKNIEALTDAAVLRRSGNTIVARYELDVKALVGSADVGALASKAPVSRYALTNHFTRNFGAYMVWWELEAAETARLNPKKGLFGGLVGNLGEPGHVHGFLSAEAVPGTLDSIVTYASYVVPKSGIARAASGTINATSRAVVAATVDRIAVWAERVGSGGATAEKKFYRDRICQVLLTK